MHLPCALPVRASLQSAWCHSLKPITVHLLQGNVALEGGLAFQRALKCVNQQLVLLPCGLPVRASLQCSLRGDPSPIIVHLLHGSVALEGGFAASSGGGRRGGSN